MNPDSGFMTIPSGKRLLIFDFDGTVADTSPLHAAAFAKALEPLGIAIDYSTIAGLKTKDAMQTCLRRAGINQPDQAVNELVVFKQRYVRELISQKLEALPGVDQFLQWAKEHYRLSMVTSGSRETVRIALKKLGYEKLFDPLVCAEDVLCGKPAPDGFLRALEITGFSKDQALIFEDSPAGFMAAQNAGVEYYNVLAEVHCFSMLQTGNTDEL